MTSFATKTLRTAVCVLGMSVPVAIGAGPSATDTIAIAVAEQFVQAEAAFDLEALRRSTAGNYVEISPIGDVDDRERMLGFYAPGNKAEGVTAQLTETSVRLTADTAIVIGLVGFSFKDATGAPQLRSMRAGFVERRDGHAWKLVSTQFTPYAPAKPGADTHG